MTGYSTSIIPQNPLHIPGLITHVGTVDDSLFTGGNGGALPSRVGVVGPTDVRPGQYSDPAAGFGHEGSGNSGGHGDVLVHVQTHDGEPGFNTHVPPKPGKNFVPGYRAYLVSKDGKASACVISGMGKRAVVNQHGQVSSFGHAETLHFRSSSTAHLPSNHQLASHCLISVQKGN